MGLYNLKKIDIQTELANARKLPATDRKEKEYRQFAIEIAKSKLSAVRAIEKYFKNPEDFVQPDYSALDSLYNREDDCDAKLKMYYESLEVAKKAKASVEISQYRNLIKETKAEKASIGKLIKEEMDKLAYFNRAAKPYLDAQKIIKEKENYTLLLI